MADGIDIKAMDSAALRSLQKEIEQELIDRTETEKKTVWEDFKAKAAGIGSSVEHLIEWATGSAKPEPVKPAVKNPAPIKFRGPDNEGWSGRGKVPKWLERLEAAGHHRSEFAVDKPKEEPKAEVPEEETLKEDEAPAEEPVTSEADAEHVEEPAVEPDEETDEPPASEPAEAEQQTGSNAEPVNKPPRKPRGKRKSTS